MSDYTFSTINDEEFEVLARDLLNAKFGYELQSFKRGPDKGIDLRSSTKKNDNSLVVQAKHYYRSGLPQLKYVLKTEELPKVKLLNPEKYLLVTSLPLSPQDKDSMRDLMAPYIRTPNEIFGKEDLNRFISEFKEIEKKHFKLWFSSTNLLNRILYNAIEGRTNYFLQKISKRFPYYVITQRLDDANKILEKEKLLLITGQPGIGKTTLAEIIILERFQKDYEIYEVTDIREAEDVISIDGKKKQLFFIDDFLGEIHMALISEKKTESAIIRFIDRIRNTPNKYLLLTSRTVVLQSAIERYEKLRRTNVADDRFELQLTDYSPLQKARILYNHVYFNDIDERYRESIIENKFYNRIIYHKNYAPRLIEFLTNSKRLERLPDGEFQPFAIRNLDNPAEIWRDSFNNEIGYFERCFLLTLLTFLTSAPEHLLMRAFAERLKFEKEHNNQTLVSDQFRRSVRILLDGFVTATRIKSDLYYSPINPSLTDFLFSEVRSKSHDLTALIFSVISQQQLNRFAPETSGIQLGLKEQKIIYQKLVSNSIALDDYQTTSPNSGIVALINRLHKYCSGLALDSTLRKYLDLLDPDYSYQGLQPLLSFVPDRKGNVPATFEFLQAHFPEIVEDVMSEIDTDIEAYHIPDLFESYEFDFDEYSRSGYGGSHLKSMAERAIEKMYEESIAYQQDDFLQLDQVREQYETLNNESQWLHERLFPEFAISRTHFTMDFDEQYWLEKIGLNRIANDEAESVDKHYVPEISLEEDPEGAIDDLFSLLGKPKQDKN